MKRTLAQLQVSRESEDNVEFKSAKGTTFHYDGGKRATPKERRHCVLGYVVALCNEGGGALVLGMSDDYPHRVVGTLFAKDRLKALEAQIYRDLGIRPDIYELYEDETTRTGRVVVIEVPAHPIGKVYKFEDVPLMRVGEELTPMSDSQYCHIIQAREPDFSGQICEGITIEDLDGDAIRVMAEKYATKHKNPRFLTLDNAQILSDLRLAENGRVTNAALILVGKASVLRQVLPQAAIMLEYRATEAQIRFDNRTVYQAPFFLMIDELWHDINLRNGTFPVREGPYLFDIPYFNEEVIREAINNAIAHRDYRSASETVIKLCPQTLTITNAGGFPFGVTLENLLKVPSTPRNRLLADVLAKTGIVERSGQGVDKIFFNTLSEGKAEPDYSRSDDFVVELTLSGVIKDQGFARFIAAEQQMLADDQKLSAVEIQALAALREDKPSRTIDGEIIKRLLGRGLIDKVGRTKGTHYILCKAYYECADRLSDYVRETETWDLDQVRPLLESLLTRFQSAQMKDFVKCLGAMMTRKQIRECVRKLVDQNILKVSGSGSATRYALAKQNQNLRTPNGGNGQDLTKKSAPSSPKAPSLDT